MGIICRQYYFILLVGSFLGGCRFLGNQAEPAEFQGGLAGWPVPLILDDEDSRVLYRHMDAVERSHRVYAGRGRPQQNEGIIRCVEADTSELCVLKVRLPSHQLSGDQVMVPPVTARLSDKMRQMGADLGKSKQRMVDLRCGDLGESIVGLGQNKYQCSLHWLRSPGEFFIESPLAEKVYQSIRSDQPVVEQVKPFKGNLTCRAVAYGPVTSCWSRAWSQGVAADRLVELPLGDALGISEQLFRAYSDLFGGAKAKLPEQLVANVDCQVDQKLWKEFFVLKALCKGRLANQRLPVDPKIGMFYDGLRQPQPGAFLEP